MLIIGLTGSIATGKTTVSNILSQSPYSLTVIDADALARCAVAPGTPAYHGIVSYFGPSTPDLLLPIESVTESSIESFMIRPLNRAALGRRVFGTSEQRRRDRAILNGLVHPAVRRNIAWEVLQAYVRGSWAVVMDVPLLFEGGLDVFCGVVLVVGVRDPMIQMRRLRERDAGLSVEEAENRVKSQGDVREKAARAESRGREMGKVVWNDRGKEELAAELAKIMAELRKASPPWWGRILWILPPIAVISAMTGLIRALWASWEWKRVKRVKRDQKAE